MGVLEELPDDSGACYNCGKVALTKCTGCKQVISPMCSEDVLKINVRTVKGAQASMRYASLSFFTQSKPVWVGDKESTKII
jgi:hypothetical protein